MVNQGTWEEAARRLSLGEPVRAAVVGAGVSGRAAARLLEARGAEVSLFDDDVSRGFGSTPARPIDAGPLAEAELVVLSPGVPRARPELAAAAHRIVGEVELASWFLTVPLVGITGTNGKSTTTALVGHLLAEAGRAAFVGGNLGEPLSTLALDPAGIELAVVELSSYQLESVESARFAVGAWLNLTPDHLDRYPDLSAYAAAKARLFERSETIVASADDALVRAEAESVARTGGEVRWFGRRAESSGTRVEDFGVAVRGDERYRIDGPGLLGPHNHLNAAAAIEIVRYFGVGSAYVQSGLSSFRGLPHRLGLVHEAAGVRWYDDSKATNVSSAVTAVLAVEGPVILIAGGLDKGGSWAPLVEAARGRVAAVLAIGAASPIVVEAFAGAIPVEPVKTLDLAVARARALAQPGGAVLLSPACASFDQFDNYGHRGDVFAGLARGEIR